MSTMQLDTRASLRDTRNEIEPTAMRLIGMLIFAAESPQEPGSSVFHKLRGMVARAAFPDSALRIATHRAIAQAERYTTQDEPGAARYVLRLTAKRLATHARRAARGA